MTVQTSPESFMNIETIFLGGGTPTALSAEQITRLLDLIAKYIPISNVKEFTSEANPDELTHEWKVELLAIPTLEVNIGGKRSPLMVAATQTTASLYKCFSGELRKVVYPEK